MKIVKSPCYAFFTCLAGKCPHTCCAGWQIAIDEESLDRYGRLRGEWGYEVKNAIDWMEEAFLQDENGCVLQREDGLCRIHAAWGEEALCDTCRTFPRHVEDYPQIREYSLSLSCPAAVELVLQHEFGEKPLEEEDPEEETLDFDEFDSDAFRDLLALREELRERLRDAQSWESCRSLLLRTAQTGVLAEPVPDSMEKTETFLAWKKRCQDMERLLSSLVTVDPDWPSVLETYRRGIVDGANWEEAFFRTARERFSQMLFMGSSLDAALHKILWAMLWVQLPGAAYDGDAASKIRICLCFAEWIREMAFLHMVQTGEMISEQDLILLICIFDRQAEHDDANLALLEKYK